MNIDFKRVLLTGSAIVALSVLPAIAQAEDCTGTLPGADCTIDEDTAGALTIDNGVTLTFSSAGNTLNINHNIDGDDAAGDGAIVSAGNGTDVIAFSSVGAITPVNSLTIGSGDTWTFSTGGGISLSSAGGFLTVDGGTLAFTNGSILDAAGVDINGGTGNDTITFDSASVVEGGAVSLGAGNDSLLFGSSGIFFASASFDSIDMGAGNDTIAFYSAGSAGPFSIGGGAGALSFGDGNDTLYFESAGYFEAGAVTFGNGDDSIIFGSGSGSGVSFSSAHFVSLDMGDGADTITFHSGGTLDVGTGTVSLGAGNDTILFESAGEIIAGTISGGSGTDTINFQSGDISLYSQVTGVENINMTTGNILYISAGGGIANGAISLGANGAQVEFNSAGGTVSGSITGGAGTQTVTLTDGTLSSSISLGADADTVNLNGGTFSGTVDLGAGADTLNLLISNGGTLAGGADADTLNIGASVSTGAAISGFETILTGANTFTVAHAITGVDDLDNTGVNVAGGVLEINSGGSIDGAIHEGGGAGTVDFGANAGGGTFNLGGIIEGVTLTLTSGTLSTNGFALGATTPLAALNVNGGTFNADDDVDLTGGTAIVAGTLTLGSGAVMTAADVDVTGTLTIDVDATATFGSFVVANDIDISGGTLTVNVGAGNLADGDELLIADGGAQVNAGAGQVALAVTDNSFLWGFEVADGSQAEVTGSADNQDLYLIVSQATTAVAASTTTNNAGAARVLQSLAATTNPQLQSILTKMNAAPTAAALNAILEAVQPTVDGGTVIAAQAVSAASAKASRKRLAALRTDSVSATGIATGDVSDGLQIWGQAFGQTADQGRRQGIAGYDSDTYGIAVGIDTENMGDNTVLGISVSFADTGVDSKNANTTNTEVDAYQFTVYGDHDLDNRTYLSGMLGYVYGQNETTRHDVGGVAGLNANGDFSSDQFVVQAELGRDYKYENVSLTPSVLAHYMHYDAENYTETGAGGANLAVNSDDMDIFELGVGLNASWDYQNKDGSYWTPDLRASYRYDFVGDAVATTSQFTGGGAAFKTEGFDPAQSSFDVGASMTYYSTDNWQFTANYDFAFKSDYDSHAGSLRAAYKF